MEYTMVSLIAKSDFDALNGQLDQGQQTEFKGRRYTKSGSNLLVRNGHSSGGAGPYWDIVETSPSNGAALLPQWAPHLPQPPAPVDHGESALPGRLPLSLGQDIRNAITEGGGKIEIVAGVIGISRSSLSNFLGGKQGMRREVREQLAVWLENNNYPDWAGDLRDFSAAQSR